MLQALPRQTLREEIVAAIMEAIFAGKFASGDRLQERDLAQQLGVSRTPLREALLELDFLGIITVQNYRGAMINRFEPEDFSEIYNVRGLLEAEAARLACANLAAGTVAQLLEQMRQQLHDLVPGPEWSERYAKADEEFHFLLWEESGSTRLRKELLRYHSIVYTIRKCLGDKYHFHTRAIEEHLAVLEALQARRPEEAAARMRYHVRKAGEHAIETMFAPKRMNLPLTHETEG